VVSGEADSDVASRRPTGRILKRQIAIKIRVDRFSAEAPEGVGPAAVTPQQAAAPP